MFSLKDVDGEIAAGGTTAYLSIHELRGLLVERDALLTERRKWIDVTDRLPDPGVAVLVYRPDAPLTQDPVITIDWVSGFTTIDPQGRRHAFKHWCSPSHWMPLPGPPTSRSVAMSAEELKKR